MNGPKQTAAAPEKGRRAQSLSAREYADGILRGDRSVLARAITLVESHSRKDAAKAEELVQLILPHSGKSRRIGITGVPGVGKSTFIESFGSFLVDRGEKIAVLAIDPSSSRSKGSILGDKTRMEKLSVHPNAFIRPSPAGESLGGVARRTRETMLLCEAAGVDTVILETVGVGQSEVTLRSMVDFFLLLLLPGAGDELQGIKKGIVEMADAVLINKAEGENRLRAQQALNEQEAALHYAQPATPGWRTRISLGSGLTGEGIPELWNLVLEFYHSLKPSGIIERRREQQALEWLESTLRDELQREFYEDERVRARLPGLQQAFVRGETTAARAARELLEIFHSPRPQ